MFCKGLVIGFIEAFEDTDDGAAAVLQGAAEEGVRGASHRTIHSGVKQLTLVGVLRQNQGEGRVRASHLAMLHHRGLRFALLRV